MQGGSHYDVPTPHVIEYGRNTLPDGSIKVNTPKGNTKPCAARPDDYSILKRTKTMNIISNWKFKKWVDWIQNSLSNVPTNISSYISLEIYPEDVEIISTILLPNTFEHRGIILLDIEGCYEKEISENFDSGILNMPNIMETQESMNRLVISEVFFNTSDKSSDGTLMSVAQLIKSNWEYYLIKKYPDRNFVVKIVGETFNPVVTFYEAP
ncbi:hypothetical protein [Psychrobacter sp. I-STPA10]|uniref:hypothetical protein n=1 Tax=Psychrobacter sp. I-STPA10 TaxID=2585769 RepID=UPI001E4B1E64|nr:hypothetical protein [Psychrobacter sp. I-STPA10]